MTEEDLYSQLLYDLERINLPIDEVDIYFRPFSKTYYGRYFPVHSNKKHKPKIYIYPFADKEGNFLDYEQVFSTAVHELCHHIQYSNACFVRNKGVMHDTQFWKLYNHYVERATKYNIIGGVKCGEFREVYV